MLFRSQWRKTPRDDMDDCRACEIDTEVKGLIHRRKWEEAIQAAQPVIRGEVRCRTVPERTYSSLIIAELSRGNLDRAGQAFEKGYRLVAGDPDYIGVICWHLAYLTRVMDFARGLRLVERHLPWVSQVNNPDTQMGFYGHTGNFFERLASQRPRTKKVRIPELLPIYSDEERYLPAKLAEWFQDQAAQIAARFDARNGNPYITWSLGDNRALSLALERQEYRA